eukprot:5153553-Prymnesium_polylepis.1
MEVTWQQPLVAVGLEQHQKRLERHQLHDRAGDRLVAPVDELREELRHTGPNTGEWIQQRHRDANTGEWILRAGRGLLRDCYVIAM